MTDSTRRRPATLKHVAMGLALAMTVQILSACVPVIVGAATVTGIELYLDRRSVGRNIDDNSLELQLRGEYLTDDQLGSGLNISVTSMNGIVLLTGEVLTDEQRQRAEQIARSYQETREVVNELELAGKTNLTSRANDSYITAKVKSKLATNGDIPAASINVTTERGKVYLMGLVTREEAELAVEETQTVSGVTHIVKVFEYLDV